MKIRVVALSVALSLCFVLPIYTGGLIKTVEKATKALGIKTDSIFAPVGEGRANQLDNLSQELQSLKNEKGSFDGRVTGLLTEVKTQLAAVKEQLKITPDSVYWRQQQTILNELYQVLKDTQRGRDQLVDVVESFITLLKTFLQDPDSRTFVQENKLHERPFYSFEDLQSLHDAVLSLENEVSQNNEQEKGAAVEIENYKKGVSAAQESYKKRRAELEAAVKQPEMPSEIASFTTEQSAELIALEDRLNTNKKALDDVRVRQLEHKIGLLALRSFVTKTHLSLVRDYVRKIKPEVRVSESDVAFAKNEFSKVKQHYYKAKESYRLAHDKLTILMGNKERDMHFASSECDVPAGRELDQWTREPQKTVPCYANLYEVGATNSQFLLLKEKQKLLDVQATLEDERFKYNEMRVRVKETYYKIVNRTFDSEEAYVQEVKAYEVPRAQARALAVRYREKMNAIPDLLNAEKKILDNIQERRRDLQKEKNVLFKLQVRDYTRCVEALERAEATVREHVELLGKLSGMYSSVVSEVGNTLRMANFILQELEARGIWHRPEDAITWQGVKNSVPDIGTFFNDIRAYLLRINLSALIAQVLDVVQNPMGFLPLIVKLLVLLIGLFLLLYAASPGITFFEGLSERGGVIRLISLLVVVALSFLKAYFLSIALWIMTFVFFMWQHFSDPYVYILFYLGSIPYLMYLANRLVRFGVHFNVRHDYIFLAPDFQRRFVVVCSGLLYATIAIFFFREAFLLGNYYRSELPTILFAVNYIILQISLILLITKELILNFIPTYNTAWQWMREQVDKYFYLIQMLVIAIIVMSHPYVGYSRLVLYVLLASIQTMLLTLALIWLHGLFKKGASRIFFFTSDDVVRERFNNAKTWFGLLIIVSFAILAFVGVIIGAKVWGWPIVFGDVASWFHEPLLNKGTPNPITVMSFVQIIILVLAGFLVSYGINRFVLDKIFDLLLVDPGVQHTVSSILQYIVITLFVFVSFQVVGLGDYVLWLVGALALSIGYLLKEPIIDFVAYFIILVQRPVKIGDYIKLNDSVSGVVRKITARAVILRKKNSTTIVLPNSQVISHSIMNWNYTRNFIAFDDLTVIVDYSADPEKAKELLLQAVESHPNILRNPRPIIRLDNFGDYGYVFMIRAFISSVYTLEQWNIASDVRLQIVKVMRENKIKLAIPVRMLFTGSQDESKVINTKKEDSEN